MNTPIDIYSDNPTVDLAYKIEVMQFALKHGTHLTQVKNSGRDYTANYPSWERPRVTRVEFNWMSYIYRIDPEAKPFVMPGFNPRGLNQHDVGLADTKINFSAWKSDKCTFRTKHTVEELAAYRQ